MLEATLDELAETGYRALSMEAVSARAGVAKTTVYRRWPTRADLVRAAFAERVTSLSSARDTGTLRGDLVDYYGALTKQMSSCIGRSLVRVVFAEGDDPELAELVRHVRLERTKLPRGLVARAIARGEVPDHTDASFLLDTLGGVLHYRVGLLGQSLSKRELGELIDRAIAGATATLG